MCLFGVEETTVVMDSKVEAEQCSPITLRGEKKKKKKEQMMLFDWLNK
jgi:hypothetical protein